MTCHGIGALLLRGGGGGGKRRCVISVAVDGGDRALFSPLPSETGAMPPLPRARARPPPRAAAAAAAPIPAPSRRALATDAPVIVAPKALIAAAGRPDVLSLAQGVVHWAPPGAAVAAAASAGAGRGAHLYGPAAGSPELADAILQDLKTGIGLGPGHEAMVTAGANQGFVNVVLSTLDANDKAILFAPYYFNHLMALQMTGGGARVALGGTDPETLLPDVAWLEAQCASPDPPKLAVLVNPCNPTGAVLPQGLIDRAVAATAAAGCWLVLDETYAPFLYGDG